MTDNNSFTIAFSAMSDTLDIDGRSRTLMEEFDNGKRYRWHLAELYSYGDYVLSR